MKITLYALVLLTLVSCKPLKQINGVFSETTQEVQKYYQCINQAENAIIKQDFHKALSHYVKGFEHKEAFVQDYINAWQVCRKNSIVDSLLLLGLFKERKKIRPDKPVSDYIKWTIETYPAFDTSFMYSFLKMPMFNTISESQKNKKLQLQIDSIFALDQKVRIEKGNITLQDSLNMRFILSQYKSKALLTEATIGKQEWSI